MFHQGDQDRTLYFVQSGLLKAFYLTADGKEFVKSFIGAGEIIGSINAAVSDENCTFSLVALEDSVLMRLDFDALYQRSQNDLETAQLMIGSLIKLAQKKERREYEFLCLSAEDRYRLIQENQPGILQSITQNDIAKYLGITPVALSRIKKRLSS